MPRYYFRLQNGEALPDREGELLADDKEARETALEIFAQTLAGKSDHLCEGGAYEVLVFRDEDGPVFSITARGRQL